ncbi:MAG: PhzF family phenazine biosynthesis protein [Lachnospiraceae bacterium]|jgi:predicted PhzF superfamily epimerase YddE/YHI9
MEQLCPDKTYIINAFTGRGLRGNPAAVCVLDEWPPDPEMQRLAAEYNLSETAFVVEEKSSAGTVPANASGAAAGPDVATGNVSRYHIRWFTPTCEVSLCGHATLSAAYVLTEYYGACEIIEFSSGGGPLTVRKIPADKGFLLEMDFPVKKISRAVIDAETERLLGIRPAEIFLTCDLVCVLEDAAQVENFRPDFEKIKRIPGVEGVIITAVCEDGEFDFVSRCFYPGEGIDEDPVTGSSMCSLMPYWSGRCKKEWLYARQASERGGALRCRLTGDQVIIRGEAELDRVICR